MNGLILLVIWYSCCRLTNFLFWNITKVIYDWIKIPTKTFSKTFGFIWYSRNINWFKYLINITFTNYCFCFRVRIKSIILSYIIIFYLFKQKSLSCHQSKSSQFKQKICYFVFNYRFNIFELYFMIKNIQNFYIIITDITCLSMWLFGYV